MRKLVFPRQVFDQLVATVSATPRGLETGVTLFGVVLNRNTDAARAKEHPPANSEHVVLAVAGPGKRATHQPAHYSGDENYANAVFEALRSALPGIRWLGELHVHPRGMTWLSGGDRRTIQQILTGQDDTLHPEEFVAGVMQRRGKAVDIYPFHFTCKSLDGSGMEVRIVDSGASLVYEARLKGVQNDRPCVCEKSEGGRTALEEASRHRWLRQWWERACRYGRKVWRRQTDAG